MAIQKAARILVRQSYPSGTAAIDQIWSRVLTALGGDAEAQLGMTGGSLTVEPGTVLSLSLQEDGSTDVSCAFSVQGSWTPDGQ